MSRSRVILEQVKAAAALAGLLALLVLAVAAAVGAARSAPSGPPRPAATVTVVADDDQEGTVAAYNAGWKAGVAALGARRTPTPPDAVGEGRDPGTVAWADGWVDGQADALGDDNRDGIVDEDESGWDCRTMGNRVCGPAACTSGGVALVRGRG
ncbi:hypothetical protein ACPCSC_30170 [Streptomyces lavendulocolor]|uniref:hypothetical protein n=1 Tax=Streptomyces lavendulocolor TaxID=67316 RepID=UPI003C2E40C6